MSTGGSLSHEVVLVIIGITEWGLALHPHQASKISRKLTNKPFPNSRRPVHLQL
ncbi:hypothetical protein GQ44DRAFT_696331 [Phaeosphaeriaceae sp. PMI808]|nr:hypothetical protein GQ44DRAFT_696331 [Phaeosphaeriaceae sp. PMI808]